MQAPESSWLSLEMLTFAGRLPGHEMSPNIPHTSIPMAQKQIWSTTEPTWTCGKYRGGVQDGSEIETRILATSKFVSPVPGTINIAFQAWCWNVTLGLGVQIPSGAKIWHRFSAFWLRSKCSICSYQLNIWYVPHWGTTILNWFLELGEVSGACSAFATGWPGIAVPPGPAHSPRGFIYTIIITTQKWTDLFTFVRAWLPWPFCTLD